MAYPNANVIYEGKLYKISSILLNHNSFRIERTNDDRLDITDSATAHLDECQLLLKPLSKISDEDAIELIKIEDKNCAYTHNGEPLSNIEYGAKQGWVYIYSDEIDLGRKPIYFSEYTLSIEQADFLRSRSYNLPFRGIDLVEAGIAILEGGRE